MIEAAGRLVARGRDVAIDIVGSGTAEYESILRNKALACGLQNRITFHGYLSGEEKSEVVRRANLFVLSSLRENFSFATAEAMASGLPVIVSNEVALHETVQRYRCGSLVPSGDVGALVKALEEYLDPSLRMERGIRAFECAKREFSLNTARDQSLAAYALAMNGTRT